MVFSFAQKTMKEYKRFPILPVLNRFSIVGDHVFVDIYSFFHFKSIHGLAIDLFERSKKCLFNYIWNTNRTTTAINCNYDWPKHIKV